MDELNSSPPLCSRRVQKAIYGGLTREHGTPVTPEHEGRGARCRPLTIFCTGENRTCKLRQETIPISGLRALVLSGGGGGGWFDFFIQAGCQDHSGMAEDSLVLFKAVAVERSCSV